MGNEQNKTLEALQFAIQMEIDGKEFYLKASRESNNELGKKLLESLAVEEDIHRRKFAEIYNAIRDRNAWLRTDFKPDLGRNLRTIFARETEKMDTNIKSLATELDAVQAAIGMETKSYDFYTSHGKTTSSEMEKEFFEALAAEEREHHLILLDYYEYLKDPAAWFVGKEHPSLDGG